MIQAIAIDLAHSAGKAAIAGDNPRTAVTPTPATLEPPDKMYGVRSEKETVVYHSGQYVYLSRRGSAPITNAQAFADNWHGRALLYAGLFNLLGEGKHVVNLIAAIPVAPLMVDSARATVRMITKWIQDKHVFSVNGKESAVIVERCLVRAQPTGAFYEHALDNHGVNRLADDPNIDLRYAVVDIGANTADIACIERNGSNLWPVPALTAGDALGLSWAATHLQKLVKAERGREITQVEADDLLLSFIKHGTALPKSGIDAGALAQAAIDEWKSKVIAFIASAWGSDHGAAVTLLTGGGASLLKSDILYPGKTILLSDPITANARGLAKYAQREGVWGK